jgi:lipopolysaccharide/colanic/teichoic acid biosynthesis glycosyltransferase
VLLVVAILVRLKLGSPVIFRQQRPGKSGRLFTNYKFRTMRGTSVADDSVAAVATDAERLTPFGRTLRSTSLDELPELWNVLRGDMSVVGPRPLLPEYLPRYNEEQARRHEVRPGITGWAQVNGRNAVSWTDRFAMDVWYVDRRSFALDARIVLKTVSAVFSREGVSDANTATMTPFDPEAEERTLEGQ